MFETICSTVIVAVVVVVVASCEPPMTIFDFRGFHMPRMYYTITYRIINDHLPATTPFSLRNATSEQPFEQQPTVKFRGWLLYIVLAVFYSFCSLKAF